MTPDHLVQIPFYANWTFWSAVFAAVAILLSQLPPIYTIVRPAKLEVDAYSRIVVTHKIGNPNVSLHLIISNIGGREVKIKNITLKLSRDDGEEVISLPAKNYYQLPADKDTVLLTPFKLKSHEEWAHIATFFNFFSRADEKLYRQLESNLKKDILKKRQNLPETAPDVAGEDENVQPLLEFFDKKFIWASGEYKATLEVETVPAKASIKRNYRFILFDSDAEELRGYRDKIPYGYDVIFNHPEQKGVITPLSET